MATASLRLNRIILLQARVVTRDVYGSEIEAWVDVAEVWANVNQTGTSEKFNNDANRTVALRNATMRIRWRDDVSETSRVIYAGLAWDIEGIAKLGRRRELELYCQTDVNARVAPSEDDDAQGAKGGNEPPAKAQTPPKPVKRILGPIARRYGALRASQVVLLASEDGMDYVGQPELTEWQRHQRLDDVAQQLEQVDQLPE